MELTTERLTALKTYLRVDGDEDDELIAGLYCAAVEYLPAPRPSQTSLYELAVNGLVLGWYDNMRCDSGNGAEPGEPPGLRRLIHLLKLTETGE